MKWKPFTYQGTVYDLSHLHPFEWTCVQEAKNSKPERRYYFDVKFSIHCFTKNIESTEKFEPELHYNDSRETRYICFDRYEQSKILPEIITSLHNRKCLHTGHGNYLTIELQEGDNEPQSYEIYFTMSQSSKKGKMNLFINSAYVRDREHGKPLKKKPIRFYVIAYNTLTNKKIRVPK